MSGAERVPGPGSGARFFQRRGSGGTVRKGGFTLHPDEAREGFCGVRSQLGIKEEAIELYVKPGGVASIVSVVCFFSNF